MQKLQRAIAESRGQPSDKALANDARKVSTNGSDESGTEPQEQGIRASSSQGVPVNASSSGTKRKYRRHPKVRHHYFVH
jgi:hypothetical protein